MFTYILPGTRGAMSSVKSGRAVNELLDTLLGVPFLSRIATSAFYTGVVVVIIIVLLAAFVFRDSESLLQKSIRLIFWGFIFTTALLMLRERKLGAIMREMNETAGTKELFAQNAQGIHSNTEGNVDVGIVNDQIVGSGIPQMNAVDAMNAPFAMTSADSSQREPLLTRAGTSTSDSNRPLISDAQLAAVANRRGYAMVKM